MNLVTGVSEKDVRVLRMTLDEAQRIYAEGPKHDVGVDAQYYIAKGFIEGWKAREKAAPTEPPF